MADLLGGEWESRDGAYAAEGIHDFDVEIPGGGCVALEVTTIADPDVVGFHNVMADTDWAVPELRSDWWVSHAIRETIGKLRSTGFTFVRSTGRRLDDVARLFVSARGGAVGNPDQLNTLLVEMVRKKHEKLAAQAQASERHLFVWLTDTYLSAPRPPAAPPIPSTLDVVWLARYAWPIRVWRLRPPDACEIVDTDSLSVRSHPAG